MGQSTRSPPSGLLALVTGAYTVYGGLAAVAWTSSLQCVMLLGGGIYVFFAGMAQDRLGLRGRRGNRPARPPDRARRPRRSPLDRAGDPRAVDERLVLRHEPVHQPAMPGGEERLAREDGRAAGRRAADHHAAGHLLSRHGLPRDQSRPGGHRRGLSRGGRGGRAHRAARAGGGGDHRRDHVDRLRPGELDLDDRHARHLPAMEGAPVVRRAAGAGRPLVGQHRAVDRRRVRPDRDEVGEPLSLRPGHLGPDGRADGGRLSRGGDVAQRRASRRAGLPVAGDPERAVLAGQGDPGRQRTSSSCPATCRIRWSWRACSF